MRVLLSIVDLARAAPRAAPSPPTLSHGFATHVRASTSLVSALALAAALGASCGACGSKPSPPVEASAAAAQSEPTLKRQEAAPAQTDTVMEEPKRVPEEPPRAQDAADSDWEKAMALKKKAAYHDAAQAFDAYSIANPKSPHASEALVEAGVCWFSTGRAKMKFLQNTPESQEAFKQALSYFDRVATMDPPSPFGGRAQYMRGSTRLFLGELDKSEAAYGLVLDKFKGDAKYAPKSLERRAAVRRSLLRPKDALADLKLYVKEYPKGEDIQTVQRYMSYCGMFEKPAPALSAEAWIQGEPTSIAALQGDLVAVYFFATWCEHCEEVRESVLDIVQRYEPQGVHFIGVVDKSQGQTVASVRAALPAKKIGFPVMMDTGRTVAAYFGAKIPDLVLIDRLGRVRWHDNPNNLNTATLDALLVEDPLQSPVKPPVNPAVKPSANPSAKPVDKAPARPK